MDVKLPETIVGDTVAISSGEPCEYDTTDSFSTFCFWYYISHRSSGAEDFFLFRG